MRGLIPLIAPVLTLIVCVPSSAEEKQLQYQLNLDGLMNRERFGDFATRSFTDQWLVSTIPGLSLKGARNVGPGDLNRLTHESVNKRWAAALDTLERINQERKQLPKKTVQELDSIRAFLYSQMGVLSLAAKESVRLLRKKGEVSRESQSILNSVLESSKHSFWRSELVKIVDAEDTLSTRNQVARKAEVAKSGKRSFSADDVQDIRLYPPLGLQLGLNSFLKNEHQTALNSFQLVRSLGNLDPALKSIALVSIGRTLYDAGYLNEASVFLDQVQTGSPFWAEAREEVSWAKLRLGKYGEVLGAARTFQTTFFKDRFLPGFEVLTAAAHFKRCEFTDAAQAIAQFKKAYLPWSNWYEKKGKSVAESKWFRWYLDDQKTVEFPTGFSNRLRGELNVSHRLSELKKSLALLDSELATIDQLYQDSPRLPLPSVGYRPYYKGYRREVQQVRDRLRQEVGAEIKTQLLETQADLNKSAEMMLLLDYELVEQVRLVLSRQKKGAQAAYRKSVEADASKEKWPVESEVWIDELNHFQEGLNQQCGKTI